MLELALVLTLIGLLAGLILPRLGVLQSVGLDAAARKLSSRILLIREESALRGSWMRLVLDPEHASYEVEVMQPTADGPTFVPGPDPLHAAVRLPSGIGLAAFGPDLEKLHDGRLGTLFAPDGFASPSAIELRSEDGRAITVVVEPASTRPTVIDGPAAALLAQLGVG